MIDRLLDQALMELQKCDDPQKLKDEFKIGDNFPILLYGDLFPTWRKLFEAFLNSPQENGFHDRWLYQNSEKLEAVLKLVEVEDRIVTDMVTRFYYEPGTVTADMTSTNRFTLYSKPQYQVDGQSPSIRISFRYDNPKQIENVNLIKAYAMAICDVLQYIIKNGVVVRVPRWNGPFVSGYLGM